MRNTTMIDPAFVCIRPRCKREPVVKYSATAAPKDWRGWLCEKHRDRLYARIERERAEVRTNG